VAAALLKRESLNGEEIKILLSGGSLNELITKKKESDSGDKSDTKNKTSDESDLTKPINTIEKTQTSQENETAGDSSEQDDETAGDSSDIKGEKAKPNNKHNENN